MTSEQARGWTSDLQDALEALENQAETTLRGVCDGVADAQLTEIVHALETLRNVGGVFHEVVSGLRGRAAQLRDRELTERRDGTALKVMDEGLASLHHGQRAATLLHHLLETGCRDLSQVADGEV